jgi:hypothetical protein
MRETPDAMEKYYIDLLTQDTLMIDAEGICVPDSSAALGHARQVACELMRGVECSRRSWRLRIRGENGVIIDELLFASVDSTLDCFGPHLRGLIESVSWELGELNETVIEMNIQRYQFRAFLAALNRRPFLVQSDGRRVTTMSPGSDVPPSTKTRPKLVAARDRIAAG